MVLNLREKQIWEQFLSLKWGFLLLCLKAVFCPEKLFLINYIHILIFLVLFYFRNVMPDHKVQSTRMLSCYFICCFFYLIHSYAFEGICFVFL